MPFDDPQIFQLVQQESARTGIHPGILLAMIKQESGGNPRAVGGAGEQGLMQIKPTTKPGVDLFDPAANVAAGADYFRENLDRFGGDPRLALSGYNQGPGATLRAGGIHPSARPYIDKIIKNAVQMGQNNLGISPELLAQHQAQLARLLGPPQMSPEELEVHRATGDPVRPPMMSSPQAERPSTLSGMPAQTASIPESLPSDMDLGDESLSGPTDREAISGGLPPAAVAPPPDEPRTALDAGPSEGSGGGISRWGWKENLPMILGSLGAALGGGSAMGALGAGIVGGATASRMSEWKEERKRKMDWENAQVEAAQKMFNDLQGLNLTEVLQAETDPEKRQLLQQATDRLAQIGKKWAEFLSPGSEGGSVITPKEAAEFMTAATVAKEQIDRVRSKASDVEISKAGRLAKEKYGAQYGAAADAQTPEEREYYAARAAAARARAAYDARRRDRTGKTYSQEADLAFVRELAKVVPMHMYQISRLRAKGDPDSLRKISEIQKEIAQIRMDMQSVGVDPETVFNATGSGSRSLDLGGGYTLDEDN